MRALRFHGEQDVRVEDVEEPSPGPGQVKLRNGYSGICGSDLHIYFDPQHSGMDYTRPHPVTGATLPQILGHEFAGEVVELGEGVTGFEVGERAAVWPVYYDGSCAACERGLFNTCVNITFHGVYSHGGGMSEFTTVDAGMLHRLPDNLDLRDGALVEPMAVAWHAVKRSGIEPGQTALVSGAGPIGIGVVFALRANGIEDVIVSEPSEARRGLIAGIAGGHLVDPTSEDLGGVVAEVTGGRGVDAAFDAAGAAPALLQAVAGLRPRGRLVVVALHEKAVEFNPTSLVLGEKEVVGALAYQPEDFDEVIAAMADGKYDTTGWVDVIGLDGVEQAFHALRAGRGMKILVEA